MKFFVMGLVRNRSMLPREVVDAPSVEVFRSRLEGVWSNLVSWKVSLRTAGKFD